MPSKRNNKQNKWTAHRWVENICKSCDKQGISLQNLQTAHDAQHHQNKQPNQKMGRRHFSTGRHTVGQEAREKMFNITNYQRNTNQNDYHQKIHKQQMLERVRREGNPPTLLVGM